MQKLGETVLLQNFLALYHKFRLKAYLRPVGFVGNADNVIAARKLVELLRKLLDLCGENEQSNIPLMRRQERTFPI